MGERAIADPADGDRRPVLDRIAQPGLADAGEVEPSAPGDTEEA